METHVITSRFALPLMVARRSGLVVEVTDGNTARYRGSFFYDLAKSAVIRLAVAQAAELRPFGVAAVAITPGFLRSEAMLEHFGVTEENWRDGAAKDPNFAFSETPHYLGRAVAALAADPDVLAKSGRALATWGLYQEYGFTDTDGSQPDFAAHWARSLEAEYGPLGAAALTSGRPPCRGGVIVRTAAEEPVPARAPGRRRPAPPWWRRPFSTGAGSRTGPRPRFRPPR